MIKQVKIFLASSVNEFSLERLILKDFTRRLCDALIDYELYIRLFICEYADNSMADGRMQDTYNHEIDDSDLFLLLVGERLGQYTFEEYLYALDRFCKTEAPRLLVAAKHCDAPGESVISFLQGLNSCPYFTFDNVSTMKAVLAETIAELLPDKTIKLSIEKGCVQINGKPVAMI